MSRKHKINFSDALRIEDLEKLNQNLHHQQFQDSRDFHHFETRAPFAVEVEADTEGLMHDLHSSPEAFRRLEAAYGSRYDHPTTKSNAHHVFELAWTTE